MANHTVIRIGNENFRLIATVDEGQTLYFTAGKAIAVEKYDMRIGKSEFDFQVNSRPVRGGRPEAIAARQQSLDREFMESRVKSNLFGLPVSLGNAAAMVKDRRVALSYGELRPQIFRSSVSTRPVAWRIWFRRTRYSGQASGKGIRNAPKPAASAKAQASAMGSAAIGAMSKAPQRGRATAIGPLANGAGILRVYVLADDKSEIVAPFDRRDVTFRDPSLWERAVNLVRGGS
ncbi:hypothetical protein SPKIRA_26830 [Sphingomonas paucimobilis]|mgnify:CR=1 FL=1|jgi:hypothetical protein|uniref:Uncharacterized protein n=2 Tax=Sphingomonas paucimobilis TaxID=13689 RepID=A0A411LL77_SPHPI|nr:MULTISPECIES: hypothetical protein [Sphingomonas]MBQ1481825.1 hypothetical protein [Sphingomonas sp.]MCM3680115.1 hypothetical protein [Sphingomonas paucimobilis]MDG5970305.1 hypothetical protein [Sphingomonas paucimobilis]NNG56263.1 hypothetical protein [Sphingomonas paucimobilis]QBE93104.1 hypothetical protein DRN02_014675 [Sphingomonas paucimobilis]